LLEPYLGAPGPRSITPETLDHISIYIDILQRWNARINLTAIRNEEDIVTRHFGESFFAARHLFPDRVEAGASGVLAAPSPASISRVADVGSGAGFPGIPIKLWAPPVSLTLIESNHKKATFLSEIVRTLTLTDVNIKDVRAESLARAQFDLVTLRAVERFESILPVAASLVLPGGRLALLIGQAQLPQAQSVLPAVEWSAAVPIPASEARVMAVGTIF